MAICTTTTISVAPMPRWSRSGWVWTPSPSLVVASSSMPSSRSRAENRKATSPGGIRDTLSLGEGGVEAAETSMLWEGYMATATQIHPVQLQYSHTIGRAEFSGPGFRVPVGMARGEGERLYVLSRAYENRPDGKRVTICTVGEEYIMEFGRGVAAEQTEADAPDGRFFWPTAIALDKAGNVYVSDEWYNRISIFTKDGDWVGKWGTPGAGDGELNRPSGMAFDPDDNLYEIGRASCRERVEISVVDGS